MLSLYRAWSGPGPCVSRPAPPPGAHRPVPRRPRAPSPPEVHHPILGLPRPQSPPQTVPLPPPSPSSSTSSELDIEGIETPEPKQRSNTVLDVASCDGPIRFSRILNVNWKGSQESWTSPHRRTSHSRAAYQYYPCKTCGSKFPSYYFVHKHRKVCHAEEASVDLSEHPEPSTSNAIN